MPVLLALVLSAAAYAQPSPQARERVETHAKAWIARQRMAVEKLDCRHYGGPYGYCIIDKRGAREQTLLRCDAVGEAGCVDFEELERSDPAPRPTP